MLLKLLHTNKAFTSDWSDNHHLVFAMQDTELQAKPVAHCPFMGQCPNSTF